MTKTVGDVGAIGAAEQLRAAGVKVTSARVRVLDSLVACGLAARSVDTRGVFRFSTAAARQQHIGHAHFRCTDCGAVFCLDAAPPPPPKLPRGFRLTEVELDLRGTCVNCARQGGRR